MRGLTSPVPANVHVERPPSRAARVPASPAGGRSARTCGWASLSVRGAPGIPASYGPIEFFGVRTVRFHDPTFGSGHVTYVLSNSVTLLGVQRPEPRMRVVAFLVVERVA